MWKLNKLFFLLVLLLATAAKGQYEEPEEAQSVYTYDSLGNLIEASNGAAEAMGSEGSNAPEVYSEQARSEYYSQPLNGMQLDSQSLKNKADALNFDEKKKEKEKEKERDYDFGKVGGFGGMGGGTMRVLAYVLAFIALAALIYYILSISIGKRERNDALIQVGMAEITNAENLATLPVDEFLNEALANGDLKLAIRLLYLKILKELFQKGWIRPSSEKTNLDYLRELSGTEFRQGFMETTGYFEKVFYGDFALERKSYDQLSGRFYALFHAIRLK